MMKISESDLKQLIESVVSKKTLKESDMESDMSDSDMLDTYLLDWFDMAIQDPPATGMLKVISKELKKYGEGTKIKKSTQSRLNRFVKVLQELSKAEKAHRQALIRERTKLSKRI